MTNNSSQTKFAFYSLGTIVIIYMLGIMFELFLGTTFYKNSDFFLDNKFTIGLNNLLFFLIPTLLFSKLSNLDYKKLFRLKKQPKLSVYFYTFLGLLALGLFTGAYLNLQDSIIPIKWLPDYKILIDENYQNQKTLLGSKSIFEFIIALIIGAMIPALVEELMFRGLFQKSLEEEHKLLTSILITSLIFSSIHFEPTQIFPLFIFSVYVGYIANYSQSIYPSMFGHFVNNFIAIFMLSDLSINKILDISNYSPPISSNIILMLIGALGAYLTVIKIRKIALN